MSRWPILLLVLLASALGLAACGDDDEEDQDPAAVLQETFGAGKDVKSGLLDVSVRINAEGIEQLSQPVTLALRGPFESSGDQKLPKFDFEVDIDAGGQAFKAGAVSTGEKGYLKFQDQAYVVPDQLFKQFRDGYAEQAKCNEEKGDESSSTFKALGIDPRKWLKNPTNEGTQEMGGVDTIHITSQIDVPVFLEDVNRVLGRTDLQSDPCADEKSPQPKQSRNQLTEAQRKKIAEAIKQARVDVWTGADDKILRRLNVDLRVEGDNAQSGDIRLDLAIGGLNEDQEIKEPKSAKPLDELLQQFGGQVPGLGSSSGSGSSGSSGGQAAPDSSSSYAQCVNEAGSDVQKLQQCAELIGK